MALPRLPLSQGIDFFMHDKNFILKRLGIKKNVYICSRIGRECV